MRGEQFDHAPGCIVAEETPMVLGRQAGDGRAAREKRLFIRHECRLDVTGMITQCQAQLGAIQDGEVRTLTREWRHQVGGIAHERDVGNAFPPMVDRQGMDGSYHPQRGRRQLNQVGQQARTYNQRPSRLASFMQAKWI